MVGGHYHTAATRSDGALFTWGYNNNGQLGQNIAATNVSSPVQVGTSSWTAVVGGYYHTAAIRSDGALFTWGYNFYGQLGQNTTTNVSSPVQVGTSSWTAVLVVIITLQLSVLMVHYLLGDIRTMVSWQNIAFTYKCFQPCSSRN